MRAQPEVNEQVDLPEVVPVSPTLATIIERLDEIDTWINEIHRLLNQCLGSQQAEIVDLRSELIDLKRNLEILRDDVYALKFHTPVELDRVTASFHGPGVIEMWVENGCIRYEMRWK